MTALGFETASAPIPPRSDIPPASHSEPRSGEESRFLGGFRDCFAKRKNEARRDSAQRKNGVYSDEVRGVGSLGSFTPNVASCAKQSRISTKSTKRGKTGTLYKRPVFWGWMRLAVLVRFGM